MGVTSQSPSTPMMCRLCPRAHRLRRARGRRARALRARVHRHHVPLPLRRAGESCVWCGLQVQKGGRFFWLLRRVCVRVWGGVHHGYRATPEERLLTHVRAPRPVRRAVERSTRGAGSRRGGVVYASWFRPWDAGLTRFASLRFSSLLFSSLLFSCFFNPRSASRRTRGGRDSWASHCVPLHHGTHHIALRSKSRPCL